MLYKTTDGGAVWTELGIGNPGGDAFMSSIVVHPGDTNIVLAAGNGHEGIARSTNGGDSWQTVLTDPSFRRIHFISDGIVVHPSAPDTLYALRNTPMILYRSANRGASWDSLSSLASTRATDRARCIAIAPDSTNIILAGGRISEVHRSTDGGRTFAVAQRLSGHPDGEIARFVWSPTVPGTVYSVSLKFVHANVPDNGGIHKSTDWGATWARLADDNVSLNALAAIPGPSGKDELYTGGAAFYPAQAEVVGNTVVQRSLDGGETWTMTDAPAWNIDPFSNATLGNVWALVPAWIPGSPTIFMATESGLFRTSPVTSVSETQTASQLSSRVFSFGSYIEVDSDVFAGGEAAFVDIVSLAGSRVQRVIHRDSGNRAIVQTAHLSRGVYAVITTSSIGESVTLFVR